MKVNQYLRPPALPLATRAGAAMALAACLSALCLPASLQAAVIYTTTEDGSSFGSIDTATHSGSVLGSSGQVEFYGNAIDPASGVHYGTWGENQFGSVNPLTGAVTAIGTLPHGDMVWALEVSRAGIVYATDSSGGFYRVDKTSGATTLIGSMGFSGNMDLAFDSSDVLYATDSDKLYTVDLATGTASPVGQIRGSSGDSLPIMGLAFDLAGHLYATAYESDARLFEINPTTAAATLLGTTGLNMPHGGDIAAVPEPSQWAMMGVTSLGVAGVVLQRYRRAVAK